MTDQGELFEGGNYLFERKGFAAFETKADSIDSDARTLEATVSSDQIDRDGEVVHPRAFEKRLDTFRKNPVFLWNHDPFTPPIGRVEAISIGEKTLDAKFRFRKEVEFDLADNIFGAYKDGILTSFSIGFRVFEMSETKGEDGSSRPPEVLDAELFEISAVTIPANTDAVVKQSDFFSSLRNNLNSDAAAMPAEVVKYWAPTDLDVLERAISVLEDRRKRIEDGEPLPDQELGALERLRIAVLGRDTQFAELGAELTEVLAVFEN